MEIDLTTLKVFRHITQVAQRDYGRAVVLLARFLEKFRDTPNQINELGLAFYHDVQYDLSRRCFEYLVGCHPQDYRAHNNLGLVLNRFGLGRQAAECYKRALSLKPDYHPARSNLAYVLHYFGEPGRNETLSAHLDFFSKCR